MDVGLVDINAQVQGSIHVLPFYRPNDAVHVLCFRRQPGYWYSRHGTRKLEQGHSKHTVTAPNGREYLIYPHRYAFPSNARQNRCIELGMGKLCLAGGHCASPQCLLIAAVRFFQEQTSLDLLSYTQHPLFARRVAPRTYCLYLLISSETLWTALVSSTQQSLSQAHYFASRYIQCMVEGTNSLLPQCPPVEDHDLHEVMALPAADLLADCRHDPHRLHLVRCVVGVL